MLKKLLVIVLAMALMLTFSVGALAQDMNSTSAVEQKTEITSFIPEEERVVEEISPEEMQQNGVQLRALCRCGEEMKLTGKTKNATTACEKFELSTGIKDSMYLYHYKCQGCGHASDYQKTICNHEIL